MRLAVPVSKPVEAELERLQRVLSILQLIQGQGGWDAKSLARECGKTQRTIFRDIQLLKDANVPVEFDSERRCYTIRADFYMQPVDLTLDEALSLIALAERVARDGQIPFTQAAVRAVAKVRGQLPEKIRRELRALEDHLSVRLSEPGPSDGVADVYADVQRAMAQRKSIRCTYESGRGGGKPFLFKPYKLHFDRRAWYVIGHHCGHEEVRWLKLNRFTSLEITSHSFEIPSKFSIEKHLGNAWRMIRGAKSYEVEILFDAEFAENIADTLWHKTQEIDNEPDGSIRFRCTVDGLDEIQWWVLARGPHCKVIKPGELAQRVKDLAAQTLQAYEK